MVEGGGGSELPTWLTAAVLAEDRCDDGGDGLPGHVTRGSRDDEGGAGECRGATTLEGVAGPEQVGRRYDLVVQAAATSTDDGQCERGAITNDADSFTIEVVPGICARARDVIATNSHRPTSFVGGPVVVDRKRI